jgi:lysophospholipase L1-like esterase
MTHSISSTFRFLGSLLAVLFISTWGGNCSAHAEDKPPLRFENGDTVALIGDSITRGGLYHSFVQLFYATRYPETRLTFFNAGRSGDAAPRTLKRLGWDVLERKPNTATVMLGMNDMGGGFTEGGKSDAQIEAAMREKLEVVCADYLKLLDALESANVRYALIGPSPYDDTAQIEKPTDLRRNDALALWTKRVQEIASLRKVGFVDFHTPMTALNHAEQAKEPTFTLVGADRIHPGALGHFVMATLFLKAQGHSPYVARVSFDVTAPSTVEAENCRVTDLLAKKGEIQFTYLAKALPFPVPNEARTALDLVPFMSDLNQELFVIKGLPPGQHGLWIDDEAVGSFSAEQFAKGINLAGNTRTPQYRQAFAVAKANSERHHIESSDLRGMAWIRSSILEPAKVKSDDVAGVERAFAVYKAKHSDPADFGLAMIKLWPKWMANKTQTETALARAIAEMHDEAQPRSHRITLRPVSPMLGLDGQQLDDVKRRAAAGDKISQDLIATIRRTADKHLQQTPVSVMDKKIAPPGGDKHDYVSLATYYWPNPKTSSGLPYSARDGQVNPETKDSDYTRLRTMIDIARGLALAYATTSDERYAEAAAAQLKTWFLDDATRMNPHLNFGQCVRGRDGGNPFGIIESAYLTDVLDADALLRDSPAWTATDHTRLQAWFRDFLAWLTTSELGQREANDKNNHGTWFDVQATSFALFVGDEARARQILLAARQRRIASQIEPDGTMPHELRRTKSAGYTLYNTRAMIRLARLGEPLGIDLWNFQTSDGRSLRKALDFISAYADLTKEWTHKQIEPFGRQGIIKLLHHASIRYADQPYRKLIETFAEPKTRTSPEWLLGD